MPYAQPSLFERPYQSGSETSHDAAIQAASFAENQRARYFDWLKGRENGTDAEAEVELAMRRSSVCARRNEWIAAKRVVKVDGCRRGGCQVWRVI